MYVLIRCYILRCLVSVYTAFVESLTFILIFQCPELYKRVKNTIGTPSLRNPNFTLSAFKNLKRVMCGMPLDDLRSFPATTVLEDVAGYLLELKCLSDKQVRLSATRITVLS